MLSKAYCYESSGWEPAEYAYRKKHAQGLEHHYFCPENNCHHSVTPCGNKNDLFWYKAHPNPHTCKHDQSGQGGQGGGDGEPDPIPPIEPELLIPNYLGTSNIALKKWLGLPQPEALTQMIANAAPAIIEGTLEDVITAWQGMPDMEVKREHPLTINTVDLTYQYAFRSLRNVKNLNDVNWLHRVVWGVFHVRPGTKSNRVFFLRSEHQYPNDSDETVSISLMINFRKFENFETAQLWEDLLRTNQRCTLFWHGFSPVIDGKHIRLKVEQENHANMLIQAIA